MNTWKLIILCIFTFLRTCWTDSSCEQDDVDVILVQKPINVEIKRTTPSLCRWEIQLTHEKQSSDIDANKVLQLSYSSINIPTGATLLICPNDEVCKRPSRVFVGPILMTRGDLQAVKRGNLNIYRTDECESRTHYLNCINSNHIQPLQNMDVITDSVHGKYISIILNTTNEDVRGRVWKKIDGTVFQIDVIDLKSEPSIEVVLGILFAACIGISVFAVVLKTKICPNRGHQVHNNDSTRSTPIINNAELDLEGYIENEETIIIGASKELIDVASYLYEYDAAIFVQKLESRHDRTCPICLETYECKDLLRMLACGHIFHDTCSSAWLGKNSSCPICNADIAVTALAVKTHDWHNCLNCRKPEEPCIYYKMKERLLDRANAFLKAEVHNSLKKPDDKPKGSQSTVDDSSQS